MIFQIRSTLALVPRVHVEEVYMRYAYAAMGKGPNAPAHRERPTRSLLVPFLHATGPRCGGACG
jgi:hypothetical protein